MGYSWRSNTKRSESGAVRHGKREWEQGTMGMGYTANWNGNEYGSGRERWTVGMEMQDTRSRTGQEKGGVGHR